MLVQGLKENDSLIHIYVVFRAVEIFDEELGRYPGSVSLEQCAEDEEKLLESVSRLLQTWGWTGDIPLHTQKVAKEFIRAGGGELHSIASLMGGIGAQEVLKLVTKQYIPVENTVVFDGIASKSEVWVL